MTTSGWEHKLARNSMQCVWATGCVILVWDVWVQKGFGSYSFLDFAIFVQTLLVEHPESENFKSNASNSETLESQCSKNLGFGGISDFASGIVKLYGTSCTSVLGKSKPTERKSVIFIIKYCVQVCLSTWEEQDHLEDFSKVMQTFQFHSLLLIQHICGQGFGIYIFIYLSDQSCCHEFAGSAQESLSSHRGVF